MSESNGKMKLSKKRATILVDIEDEDGTVKEYTLVEMSGAVRDMWMASMSKRMKLDASGKPVGVNNFDGLQSSLIARCLQFGGNPVGEDEIQKWPSSTQKQLFDACQNMNGLTDTGAEAAKKD